MNLKAVVPVTLSLVALVACHRPSSSSSSSSAAPAVGSATLTSASGPKGGSCNEDKAGICTEYADNPLGIADGACTQMFKGTYGKGSCAKDNLIGSCQRQNDKGVLGDKIFYYYGNGLAPWLEDAVKDCEQNPLFPGGKFTAEPNAAQAAKDHALPLASHVAGSCQNKDGSCEDSTGRFGDMSKSFCEDGSAGGKYTQNQACPADALVGSCVKTGGVTRYYTSNLKANSMKDLEQVCTISGHWYPGPAAPAPVAAKGARGAKAKARKK